MSDKSVALLQRSWWELPEQAIGLRLRHELTDAGWVVIEPLSPLSADVGGGRGPSTAG